jgi:hypothetical protein
MLLWGTTVSAPEPKIKTIEIKISVEITAAPVKKTDQEILAALKTEDPLIDCLIEHESTYDCTKIGKAGEVGCLQFLPKTYAGNCVNLYGLPEKNDDLEYQIACAKKMIAANELHQWTTWVFCTQYQNI